VRILGIDTSLRCTGYGVVRIDGRAPKVLDCGVIKNPQKLSQLECLKRLSLGVEQLIQLYKPDVVAIEDAFFYKNARTAMILGMARGAVLACCGRAEVPSFEYAPKKAKLAVTGTGNASKEQVAYMMAQILKVDISVINDDATDALAIALCHWQSTHSQIAKVGRQL